ncbi:MAG: tRNA (adenosine(37)-N6)-threonylcarbamoyltransferase complex ATPase subunit type 1 TsaE [Pseudomonadota bacterium]|nr:tRNA (adenosine(37)-N6)-threonylcarbamoyltransferase complex ATPase subunit type 1 TsaE [Pseudomonadota bacterium]
MKNGNATISVKLALPDISAVRRFAGWIAPRLNKGDWLLLSGDLGAGKTELARCIIRQIFGVHTDVPSPTFTLIQHYESPEIKLLHTDLYRLESSEEVAELGLLDETDSIFLVEWPEKLGAYMPEKAVTIHLEDVGFIRQCTLHVAPDNADFFHGLDDFINREKVLTDFLEKNGYGQAVRTTLAGDASSRRYERLEMDNKRFILMDWPALPNENDDYKAKVFLSKSVTDFRDICAYLIRCGLSAPEIYAQDDAQGLLVLEDFGQHNFTETIDAKDPHLPILYHESIMALAALYHHADTENPQTNARQFSTPVRYDKAIILTEIQKFIDWYMPSLEKTLPDSALVAWEEIWGALVTKLEAMKVHDVMMLRDVHSPNLHWLDNRQSIRRVGFIDIQDGIAGHPAYDVVSLLQDARRDLPKDFEGRFKALYVTETGLDAGDFDTAYNIFGVQRNLRILGIFVWLSKVQGKSSYLQHIPRVNGYIKAGLAHAALADLRRWFETYVPEVLAT